MDLLGPSLGTLKKKCKGKFSLATTLKISIQLLNILEQIHDKRVIIRYLKPDNMVLGLNENANFVYLIDFGTAKFYIKKGEHIKYVENRYHIKGNRDFIYINYHKRIEASRRDDIESLGYNLVNFMKGKLPWTDLNDSKLILQKKIDTSLDELCEGLPGEFKEFIDYARKLEFKERPNYSYLNELLIKAAKNNDIDLDKVEYDWINLKINEKKVKDVSSNEEHKENKIKESENGSEAKDDNNKEKKELINNEKNDELNDKNEDMIKKKRAK
jgi:serine/threonine protein kinase